MATSPVYNPSRGEVISEVPMCGSDVVNDAVNAAADAFPGWRDTPSVERARLFFRYRQLVEENFDRICQLITREHGKTLAEAKGSAYRGLENIEYACGVPTLLMGDTLENLARGVDCETTYQPLGVCVGITPFNFPAMVPMWMFPLALACGNTFVLKPSEKVPLTANYLIELLEKAGLPKGVLNVVHGGRECVDALLTHPKVRAISFVGSSPVAKHIYETGTRHGKPGTRSKTWSIRSSQRPMRVSKWITRKGQPFALCFDKTRVDCPVSIAHPGVTERRRITDCDAHDAS